MLRFLVIRPDRIGDAIVTQVAIEALFKTVECQIDILASNYNYRFYQDNPYISNIFYCDIENKLESKRYYKLVVRPIHYDAVFVLQSRRRLQKLSLLSKCKYRFGLDLVLDNRDSTNSFQWFMKKVYKFNYVAYDLNQHEALNMKNVINAGLSVLKLPQISTLPEKCNLYSKLIKPITKTTNSVVINISGKTELQRNILPSMLMSLLLLLKNASKIAIIAMAEDKVIADNMVALLTKHDKKSIADDVDCCDNRYFAKIDVISDNDVFVVANQLNSFEYYIGADGGLLHIAAALGLKCVGLYNENTKDTWHPWVSKQICLSAKTTYMISPAMVMNGLLELGLPQLDG